VIPWREIGRAAICVHPGYAGDDVERCVVWQRTVEEIATDYRLAHSLLILIQEIGRKRAPLLDQFGL
jgi:hypothetical protein